MEKFLISDLLSRVKNSIVLEDEVEYKRVTIKSKNAGIVLRDIEYGHNIGTKKQFVINKGQFLLSKIDARNGAFGIVNEELNGAIITGNFWAYEVNKKRLNIEWFNIFVSSSEFISICDKASSGTTNRRYLDETKFLTYQINLPSLKDQDVFVTRYKELSSKLDLINNEINMQEKYLKDLRNSILQDAVQGKLVPQDPNDEPAEVLLEKIREEKERLIKEKKIKKEKPLAEISEEEKPFELPCGWEWVRLLDANIDIGDVDHRMPKEVERGIPYISPRDFYGKNEISFDSAKKISMDDYMILSKKSKPEVSDIIFPRYGTIGVIRFVEEEKPFLVSYSCATIKTYKNNITPNYIRYYLESNIVKDEIIKYVNKTTQPNVGVKSIKNFICPIPPLEEQKRIIEKVDSLMKLCDQLEKKIQKQKDYSNRLMESILKSSF